MNRRKFVASMFVSFLVAIGVREKRQWRFLVRADGQPVIDKGSYQEQIRPVVSKYIREREVHAERLDKAIVRWQYQRSARGGDV